MKTFSAGSIFWLILAILSVIFSGLMTWIAPYNMNIVAQTIVADGARVLPANDGKLVLVNGSIKTKEDFLEDPLFGISIHTPVLLRYVEMRQWAEFKKTEKVKDGDGDFVNETVYEYETIWSKGLIDSHAFHETGVRENPKSMPYRNEVFTGTAHVGDFTLSDEQMKIIQREAKTVVTPLNEEPARRHELRVDGEYYTDVDGAAKIGDIRISFMYVDPAVLSEVTILAMQSGDSFVEGKDTSRFWLENKTKEQVVSENTNLTIALLVILWCWSIFCIYMTVSLIRKKRRSRLLS